MLSPLTTYASNWALYNKVQQKIEKLSTSTLQKVIKKLDIVEARYSTMPEILEVLNTIEDLINDEIKSRNVDQIIEEVFSNDTSYETPDDTSSQTYILGVKKIPLNTISVNEETQSLDLIKFEVTNTNNRNLPLGVFQVNFNRTFVPFENYKLYKQVSNGFQQVTNAVFTKTSWNNYKMTTPWYSVYRNSSEIFLITADTKEVTKDEKITTNFLSTSIEWRNTYVGTKRTITVVDTTIQTTPIQTRFIWSYPNITVPAWSKNVDFIEFRVTNTNSSSQLLGNIQTELSQRDGTFTKLHLYLKGTWPTYSKVKTIDLPTNTDEMITLVPNLRIWWGKTWEYLITADVADSVESQSTAEIDLHINNKFAAQSRTVTVEASQGIQPLIVTRVWSTQEVTVNPWAQNVDVIELQVKNPSATVQKLDRWTIEFSGYWNWSSEELEFMNIYRKNFWSTTYQPIETIDAGQVTENRIQDILEGYTIQPNEIVTFLVTATIKDDSDAISLSYTITTSNTTQSESRIITVDPVIKTVLSPTTTLQAQQWERGVETIEIQISNTSNQEKSVWPITLEPNIDPANVYNVSMYAKVSWWEYQIVWNWSSEILSRNDQFTIYPDFRVPANTSVDFLVTVDLDRQARLWSLWDIDVIINNQHFAQSRDIQIIPSS